MGGVPFPPFLGFLVAERMRIKKEERLMASPGPTGIQ
jgi:hypothetical protein